MAHLGHHLFHQGFVLESIPAGESGLDQSPPQGALAQRSQGSQLGEDRAQSIVLLAMEQKIVPQGQENVDVGFENQPPY
jgi:hypothetical protein